MLAAAVLDVVVLELAAFEVVVLALLEDVVVLAELAELVDVLLAELVVETDPPLLATLKIAMS